MQSREKEFEEQRRANVREIQTLKRNETRASVQLKKLEMLQQRQQAVLKRKTEEAEAARKKLQVGWAPVWAACIVLADGYAGCLVWS